MFNKGHKTYCSKKNFLNFQKNNTSGAFKKVNVAFGKGHKRTYIRFGTLMICKRISLCHMRQSLEIEREKKYMVCLLVLHYIFFFYLHIHLIIVFILFPSISVRPHFCYRISYFLFTRIFNLILLSIFSHIRCAQKYNFYITYIVLFFCNLTYFKYNNLHLLIKYALLFHH